MADVSSLSSRLDAAWSALEQKMKSFQVGQAEEHRQRQKRLGHLTKVFDELLEVLRPRLELLVKKFGDRVKVTARVVPTTREATFDFQSNVAKVRRRFSASTDRDVKKVILSYALEIIPVLMRYKAHDEVEFPLDKVDKQAAVMWIDDRIMDFVETYLSMGENEIYMKDSMVEDPVARVRFPKQAAAATLEWQSQTYYFIGDDTRREFAEKNKISIK